MPTVAIYSFLAWGWWHPAALGRMMTFVLSNCPTRFAIVSQSFSTLPRLPLIAKPVPIHANPMGKHGRMYQFVLALDGIGWRVGMVRRHLG